MKLRIRRVAATLCLAFLAGVEPRAFCQAAPAPSPARAETPLPNDWQTRLKDGQLTPAEITAAAREVLRRQADVDTKWETPWGDFMELARAQGKLPDDLWQAYLFGAVRVNVRVATEVSRSDGLPIFIEHQSARTGRNSKPAQAIGIRQIELSGLPCDGKVGRREGMNLASGGGSGLGWTEDLNNERYASLKPGPQTLHYRYEVKFTEVKGADGKPPATIGERVIEGKIPWRLLVENEAHSLPALDPDPALRALIEKSFSRPYVLRDEKDKTLSQVMIQVDRPVVNMAFEMALRADGVTWPLGPVGWMRNRIGWYSFEVDLPEEIRHVDMVLTPSPRAAVDLIEGEDRYRLMDMTTIWGGAPIVIHNVEVRKQRIRMKTVRTPDGPAALKYALAQMDPDDAVTQQLKTGKDTALARRQLDQRIKEQPRDAMARYQLGCVLTAEGALPEAMQTFVEAQRAEPAPELGRQIQREQRRLAAMWLTRAEKEDVAAMTALGKAYENGWGAGLDFQEAKRWYRSGANAGLAEAMCRLASMYERKAGATMQTAKADQWYRTETLEWYRKAAALDHAEAKQWILTHDR